jgi:hypothetical protein
MRIIKLGFIFLLLLSSCAQVGTITGGEKDVTAPKIKKRSIPEGAVNFNSKEISLDFDEYFQLVQSQGNIAIVPPDALISCKVNKKRLTLSWSEQLKPTTTYRIYLNSAVKDVSEGNSELINLIFSTGPTIDSLVFNALVLDAFYGTPLENVLLGLYDSLNQQIPRYFMQSNADGLATIKNIAKGTYFCKAMIDLNKDLTIQESEIQGGSFEGFMIEVNGNDTLRIGLSKPTMKDKIKNIKYIPPGLIGLHFPKDMKSDSLFFNGNRITPFFAAGTDSLLLSTGPITSEVSWLVIGSDSTRIRTVSKDRSLKLIPKLLPQNPSNAYPFHAIFEVKDKITGIDLQKMSVLNLTDSTKITPDSVVFSGNKLEFFLKWNSLSNVLIHGDEGAITGFSGATSSLFNTKVTVSQKRDYGSIVLNSNTQTENAIIQLMKGEVLVREISVNKSKKYVFTDLIPGEYYVRILLDANMNGKWDPINWEAKRQAETIMWYRSILKVRANWEVEGTLTD